MKLFALIAACLFAAPAYADDYLILNIGSFDFVQEDNEAGLTGLEYRFEAIDYGIRPMVGAFLTTDTSVYGYAGLHWDAYEWEGFTLGPNFAVGLYTQGHGKKLGHAFEMRTGLELSYDVYDEYRASVAVNHMSNASIGDDNPGTEAIMLGFHIPLGD